MSYSFETPWTVVHLAPLSMVFPRQEYCSGFPFPTPGDFSNPEIEQGSPALAFGFFITESPRKPPRKLYNIYKASQVVLVVKNLPTNVGDVKRCGFNPLVGEIPWRGAWQPTPVFLPRESLGQRSLVGYSPQGHKELDMTEAT